MITLDRQKLESMVINSGVEILDDKGCSCLKGAIIYSMPENSRYQASSKATDFHSNRLYHSLVGKFDRPTSVKHGFNYALGTDYSKESVNTPLWRREYPQAVAIMDKYELRLMYQSSIDATQEYRKGLLKDMIAELEELCFIQWVNNGEEAGTTGEAAAEAGSAYVGSVEHADRVCVLSR